MQTVALPTHVELTTDPRHQYFLREAYRAARDISDDPKTQVGAVLTEHTKGGHRMLARAANHLKPSAYAHLAQHDPAQIQHLLSDTEWKKKHMRHAEDALIKYAWSLGIDPAGKTVYMPWAPCKPCGEKILDAGIAQLVMHKQLIKKTPPKWVESTTQALEDLAGEVQLLAYDGRVEGTYNTFVHEVWQP